MNETPFVKYKDYEIVKLSDLKRIRKDWELGSSFHSKTYYLIFHIEKDVIKWKFDEEEERNKVYETIISMISFDITDMSKLNLV